MIEILLPELNLKITIHIEPITPPTLPMAADMRPVEKKQQLTYHDGRQSDEAA